MVKNEERTMDSNNVEVTKSDLDYYDFCQQTGTFITRRYFGTILDAYAESGLPKEAFIEKYMNDNGYEFFYSNGLRYSANDIYSEFGDIVDDENYDDEIDILKLMCSMSDYIYQLHDQLCRTEQELISVYKELKDQIPNSVNYWKEIKQ